MPRLVVLPHPAICPKGAEIKAEPGESIIDALLRRRIPMDHACGKSCACASCHIIVRAGYEGLAPPGENEENMLDKATGLEPQSRLGCQTRIGSGDLTIQIPFHTMPYAGS